MIIIPPTGGILKVQNQVQIKYEWELRARKAMWTYLESDVVKSRAKNKAQVPEPSSQDLAKFMTTRGLGRW